MCNAKASNKFHIQMGLHSEINCIKAFSTARGLFLFPFDFICINNNSDILGTSHIIRKVLQSGP